MKTTRYQPIALDQIDSLTVREAATFQVATWGAAVSAYTDHHGQHVQVDNGEYVDLYQDGRLVAHLSSAAARSER